MDPTASLPAFRPVGRDELRQFWASYPSPDVRRLILEVERSRRVLAEIDLLYATIHKAWRERVGGDLVALHLLKQLMATERQRRPAP
ncbi:hypothetical protein [Pseudomonas sp. JG-B]|uniref:hypothetical protein n=1 Tax=Pseudomonas sp. JG-B TaxID=2603214 RepID=UPI0012C0E20C|nr:hypothetical protein [Pseudomonas sp. JG-B]MRK19107.1 hypothetical protein [Pseudomonas sp. JG-B]